MPMLPIPAFVALVLGFLAVKTFLAGGRPFLLAFLAMCAVQSLVVTLAMGYDFDWLRPVMPVSATLVPGLAWITFQDALISQQSFRSIAFHAIGPAFTLFCRLFAPETTDFAVSLVFASYGCAILLYLQGTSDMPLARLEAGPVPARIWRVLGWALIASALGDVLIALAFITGHENWAGWLVALSSSLALLLLGVLSVSPDASGMASEDAEGTTQKTKPDTNEEDIKIIETLETFLKRTPVHLDPNLTLSRLARRVHLPEKRLSTAVNRVTGSNVSRYINAWRIRHACELLENGASATDAMLASGFNTKSNFNREFSREKGVPPSQWRMSVQSGLHSKNIAVLGEPSSVQK